LAYYTDRRHIGFRRVTGPFLTNFGMVVSEIPMVRVEFELPCIRPSKQGISKQVELPGALLTSYRMLRIINVRPQFFSISNLQSKHTSES